MSKRRSTALTLWIQTAKDLGYNQVLTDPKTGKKKLVNVPKKGTADYEKIKAEYENVKHEARMEDRSI